MTHLCPCRTRQADRSPRPMRAGRRSTISCSARCSSAGAHAAIAAAERIGGRILEVGVGTGISLPDYAPDCRLCGIDISEPMLRKAQERVAELGLSQRRGPRGHGRRAPRLSRRVVRRGGGAICRSPPCPIRKRRSTSSPACSSRAARSCWSAASAPKPGLRRALEHWFAPAARKLGWRTEFPFERYAQLGRTQPHGMRLDRAPRDAAARPLLADPLRQDRRAARERANSPASAIAGALQRPNRAQT